MNETEGGAKRAGEGQAMVEVQGGGESQAPVGSSRWHKDQIAHYAQQHGAYAAYASALEQLLKTASATRAPLAIVHSRAKTVSSFAEKALKLKDGRYRYSDPVNELTDLCGARVITQTQEEADRIGRFIEATFTVDRGNSSDVRARLLHDQFGYRSVHYVVSLPETPISGLDAAAHKTIGIARKAEIQVRTLLQHVWADIGHDRLYKSQMAHVPEAWIRESARLAAVLEKVDDGFATLVRNTEAYSLHYGALKTRERAQSELEALQTIIENEREPANKQSLAVRKARLLRSGGHWNEIDALLTPYAVPAQSPYAVPAQSPYAVPAQSPYAVPAQSPSVPADSPPDPADGEGATAPPLDETAARIHMAVLLELGLALCQANTSDSDGARRGREYLAQVARPDDDPSRMTDDPDTDKLRTFALVLLAQSIQDQPDRGGDALALFHAAIRREPSNPYYLVDAIAQEISVLGSRAFLPLMRPALESAIATCRAHAAAEIALPWAYVTIGKAQLFLGEPYEALASYAKAMSYYLDPKLWLPGDLLGAEVAFIRRAQSASDPSSGASLEGSDWIGELLELAEQAKPQRNGDQLLPQEKAAGITGQVVIVIGGTDHTIEARMQDYKEIFEAAFEKFTGTVIAGGTTAGISGLMGTVAAGFPGPRSYKLIGYRPAGMPSGIQPDDRYDEQRMTPDATDFTVREPFAYWRDILQAGINPVDVILIGINGGRISAFEYRLALALGATVGIVGDSWRSAGAIFADIDWLGSPNLIWLADNPISLVALLLPRTLPTHLDDAAREAHEEYKRCQLHPIPAMRDWQVLPDDLKDSNRSQMLCSTDILRLAGYGLRPLSPGGGVNMFPPAAVETMAVMEHARWIVERRKRNWKYSGRRDLVKQESPHLIPWQNLPEAAKENDRRAVMSWPRVLAKAGWEIFEL